MRVRSDGLNRRWMDVAKVRAFFFWVKGCLYLYAQWGSLWVFILYKGGFGQGVCQDKGSVHRYYIGKYPGRKVI